MSRADEGAGGPSRRTFLASAASAGATLGAAMAGFPGIAEAITAGTHPDAAPPSPAGRRTMKGVPFEAHAEVRIAIVGTGLRGRSILSELLAIEGCRVTVVCDTVADKAQRAARMITDRGQPAPAVVVAGDRGFEQVVTRDDVDFVYTATPWEWHVPVMLAALAAGKHCGSECPLGTTLREQWALVDASEQARRHCLQLENCNYGQTEMLVNRLVHAGELGELLHAEAAYLHDLRDLLFEDRDEGLWRRWWHTRRDANLYPTHGLGPVAWYLDIHRGDRFDYLVAMASPEAGLTAYRAGHVPDRGNPKWQERYVTGDQHTALIKTVRGRTIMLQHNVSNPRPYSRLNNVQGTKGAFADYPPRIYVDGQAGGHRWATLDAWRGRYEDPLWTRIGELARAKGGHGGMDFVMCWRLVQCLREGLVPDFDVYDAAAWSAPFPLTEMSVAKGSQPMRFPDFTRGAWTA